MAIFWDLDNLRPPLGFETVWAYRLVEAAFEYADVAHVRAYARVGTLPDFARDALVSAGVTLRECPAVSEGADAALASDVVAIVRGGARALASDAADDEDASSASSASSIERDPNPALEALTRADSFAVMVATRDEGMAECVSFASARRDLCDGALVAGEFLAKAAHRPQFAAALAEGGDVGVTPGYWRILNHVAGKSAKGAMGKSKLARAADATVLWDSRRLFALPGPAEEEREEEARRRRRRRRRRTASARWGRWTTSTISWPRREGSPRCGSTGNSSRGPREPRAPAGNEDDTRT